MTQLKRQSYQLNESWYYLIDNLMEKERMVSRAGDMREWTGCCFGIKDHSFILGLIGRHFSPIYGAAEFLWYMSGSQSGDMIKAYAPSYERFLDANGIANGAYGHRWFSQPWGGFYAEDKTQFEYVLRIIDQGKDTNTRQAVLSTFWPTDSALAQHGGCKDIPCTLSIQFLPRDGKLHTCVSMRSNDVWLGLPYDIFCFQLLSAYVAGITGLMVGEYTHFTGSMHLYQKNFAAAAACKLNEFNENMMTLDNFEVDSSKGVQDEMRDVVRAEKEVREYYSQPKRGMPIEHYKRLTNEYAERGVPRYVFSLALVNWLDHRVLANDDTIYAIRDACGCLGSAQFAYHKLWDKAAKKGAEK